MGYRCTLQVALHGILRLICFSNYRSGYMIVVVGKSSHCARIWKPLRYDHVEKFRQSLIFLLSDNSPHAHYQIVYPFKLYVQIPVTALCGAPVAWIVKWRTAGPGFPFRGGADRAPVERFTRIKPPKWCAYQRKKPGELGRSWQTGHITFRLLNERAMRRARMNRVCRMGS